MATIDSFTSQHRFLSNFEPARVTLDGLVYRTVEHAYQAAKTEDFAERSRVWAAPSAAAAKKLGRRVTLRPDWECVKLGVMEDFLRQKFRYDPLKSQLRATGDALLVEGNAWGDTYWGVCCGVGENHLGRLLMKIRAEG